MDAFDQLSQYRDVPPVDNRVVSAALDVLSAAISANSGSEASRRGSASWRRLRRSHRIAVAVAGALALVGAGCSIAAAAGLFDPPTPLPSAQIFMTSTNPAKIPGAAVQLNIKGPDGVTFEVVTDTVSSDNQSDDCVALGIIGADGQPAASHGNAECAGLVAPVGSSVPPLKPVSPSEALEIWSAPSGITYDLIFGQSAPGITEVALANENGQVGPSEPANAHGYVIYISAASFADYGHLVFSNKSGKILFTQDLNP